MHRIAAAALVALVLPAFSQVPRVAALDWMAGTWVAESESGEKVLESWLGPGNGLMVAANLTTRPNGRKSFEFLRIADMASGYSYYASPGGKTPVEFPLKQQGERRVVFENAAHDFPQRILYWREGEVLLARVEGTLRGEPRSQEWRFTRR